MSRQRPHVIVLAGGEGSRLQSLTHALYGFDLPKQFAVLVGDRSLMQATIERAMLLTTADRISVVVTSHHEATARGQLAPYPGVELVVQPRNLDTGPGLLLPLIRIVTRSPGARIVVLPSDHYVPSSAPLVDALVRTECVERVALIGVQPTGPEVEYGWIVPGARLDHGELFEVERFHEKPSAAMAELLYQTDGLWNTFISAGPARVYWALARLHLPRHAGALERYAAAIGGLDEPDALDDAFRTMTPANFSRDVLAVASALTVTPVKGTGWSDWGSPARVFASLAGTPGHDRLVERIRGDTALAG